MNHHFHIQDDILLSYEGRDESVIVPEGIRTIGEGAFKVCVSLKQVSLPSTLCHIMAGAFKGCRKLRKIQIPQGVTKIGDYAFHRCHCLREILLPDSVERLGDCAFLYCDSLVKISMPGVCRFGRQAFVNDVLLEELVISSNLCGEDLCDVFTSCGRISRIRFSDGKCFSFPNVVEVVAGEMEVPSLVRAIAVDVLRMMELDGRRLVRFLTNLRHVEIPEGIESIKKSCFFDKQGILSVRLPASLRVIESQAFRNCIGLESVIFQRDDVQILEDAFQNCTALGEITVRDGTTYTFQGISGLAGQRIPPLVQTIYRQVMDNFCISGTILPPGLTAVKANTFRHCHLLRELTFGPCVREIGEMAFYRCDSLEICECPQAEVIEDFCFCGCGKLLSFDCSSVRQIGSYGFQDCDSLRSVDLNNGAVLMPHAFKDCGRLKQARLLGDDTTLILREYAFSGCTSLRTVIWKEKTWQLELYSDIFSDSLPQMARQIFASTLSCFLVEKETILTGYRGQGRILRIPAGIRQIAPEVFRDILMLEEVEIPETVTDIGARAFHQTAWLENQRQKSPLVTVNHILLDGSQCKGDVTVPAHIRQICGWAFAGGMDIRRIRFLSESLKVGEYAFRNCIGLEEMALADGTVIRFGGIADRQRELPPVAKQTVTERLNCFKTDTDNALVECTGNIARLMVAEGITAIKDHVFQDGNLLTMVRLPSTVTSIGAWGFAGCKWLTKVEHGIHVERIGDMAFAGCGRLESVELSEKLHVIGRRAFENCTSLKEIYIPEGVEEIPERAFFRCHSLKQVVLPSTLKRIGREAFAFCKNLRQPSVRNGVVVDERAFVGIR